MQPEGGAAEVGGEFFQSAVLLSFLMGRAVAMKLQSWAGPSSLRPVDGDNRSHVCTRH